MLLEKSIKVFSKPSGLKYKHYFQGYIHFSNRRYTKKKTPGRAKVSKLQKPVRILKKFQNMNLRKSPSFIRFGFVTKKQKIPGSHFSLPPV